MGEKKERRNGREGRRCTVRMFNYFTFCCYNYKQRLRLLSLQDLSNYKYDKMVNRALALLNKFYSAKSRMFKMGVQAMVCQHKSVLLLFHLRRRCLKAPEGHDCLTASQRFTYYIPWLTRCSSYLPLRTELFHNS